MEDSMEATERKECLEFWQDIIYKDGKLDEEAVLKELYDYMIALQEVPKVYCAITGGKLSKVNYFADVVIGEYEDDLRKNYIHKDDLRSLLD
jgi:hypothetical protein